MQWVNLARIETTTEAESTAQQAADEVETRSATGRRSNRPLQPCLGASPDARRRGERGN